MDALHQGVGGGHQHRRRLLPGGAVVPGSRPAAAARTPSSRGSRRAIRPNSPRSRTVPRRRAFNCPRVQSRPPPAGMGYDVLAIAPTSFFADYGCHVRILEETRALGRRGHRVTVCTYHSGRDPQGVRGAAHAPRALARRGARRLPLPQALLRRPARGARACWPSPGPGGRRARPPARRGPDRLLRQPPAPGAPGLRLPGEPDPGDGRPPVPAPGEPALPPGGLAGAHHRRPGGRRS